MVYPTPFAPRTQRLERLAAEPPEVLVVGGGITGAGIALDLALRGVRALLIEQDDWAAATSSASSRLIHGGLRYLEQFELGLVRESCLERALLLRNAAGLVWPERFLFPVRRGDRVGLGKLAAGLGLYTLLSIPRTLGIPGLAGRARVRALLPGVDAASLRGAGTYLDAATDDARLTLAVVASAAGAGATVLSRTELVGLESGRAGVEARLGDRFDGGERTVQARAAVLCGGPFTEALRARAGLAGRWITPTRGSHVLVPRERLPTDGAVIFPSAVDGRVMFLIPWPRHTVIGTTDLDADAAAPPRATRAEVRYLLDSTGGLFPAAELSEADVVATWSGLRPLLAAEGKDPSARSREERVVREGNLYTIAGGKLTGYRAMAEKLVARLARDTGLGRPGRRSPTRGHRLHGALERRVDRPEWSRLGGDGERALEHAWGKRYPAAGEAVMETCRRAPEGLRPLDGGTLLGEVDWAVRHEDCLGLADFCLRRTDLAYAPREEMEARIAPVLERLSGLLGWGEEQRARDRAEFGELLERIHGWRADPVPGVPGPPA